MCIANISNKLVGREKWGLVNEHTPAVLSNN